MTDLNNIPRWLQSQAEKAPHFNSLSEIFAEAKRKQERVLAWAQTDFYEVYPGGRAVCWTRKAGIA